MQSKYDPDGWMHLDPYTDEIEVYRNGDLIYSGPASEVFYGFNQLGLKFPTDNADHI